MLSIKQAIDVVKKNLPNSHIDAMIVYKDLYLFMIFGTDELEGAMDPFYSVNIDTGEFRDFSITSDGDISRIMKEFEKCNDKRRS